MGEFPYITIAILSGLLVGVVLTLVFLARDGKELRDKLK